jgi:hypothetical protein
MSVEDKRSTRLHSRWRQRGAVIILFSALLPVLIGFSGVAIDLSRAVLLKSQLRTIAEDAAISGANYFTSTAVLFPSWPEAETEALLVSQTRASMHSWGELLTSSALAGWWSGVADDGTLTTGLTPQAQNPWAPAVKLTLNLDLSATPSLRRDLFPFASILGVAPSDFSVRVSAVRMPPGLANSGSLYPIFLYECLFAIPNVAEIVIGKITNNNNDVSELNFLTWPESTDDCQIGRWTRFSSPNSSSIKPTTNLSQAVAVGDNLYIDSGISTNSSLRQTNYYPSQGLRDPYVAVVDASNRVKGFVPIRLTSVQNASVTSTNPTTETLTGSRRWVKARLLSSQVIPIENVGRGLEVGDGNGKYFGGFMPAMLAQ